MKTTPKRLDCFTLIALLLAPLAGAQPVHVGAGARAAAARPNLPPPAAVHASATANATPAVRTHPPLAAPSHPSAQAGTQASVVAQERGLRVAALANSGATADEIRTAAQANRDAVLANVDAQIEVGGRITAELNRQARHLDGEAKVAFKSAMKDLKAAEKAVRRSLRTARKATADAQAEAQAQLATDYTAYTEAVARAQAAAQASTSAETKS